MLTQRLSDYFQESFISLYNGVNQFVDLIFGGRSFQIVEDEIKVLHAYIYLRHG